MRGKIKYFSLFIMPGLIGIIIFFMAPFFLSVYYSFTTGVANIQFVGLNNFRELIGNPAFILASQNTLLFLLIGVPAVTMLALILSVMMSKKLYRFPRWAMLSPMVVPVASVLMGWQAILGDGGLVNGLIGLLGGQGISFFREPYVFATIMLLFIIKNTGFMIIIFSGEMATIPREYEEVFSLDSNSKFKYVRHVLVPLMTPIIIFVVILGIINSFQIYREVYGLFGNFPPKSFYLLQYFMNNNFYKLNFQRLSTAALILTLLISVIISLFLWYQNKNLDSWEN